MIEIGSPGNKHLRHDLDDFNSKVAGALKGGICATVINPFPPGRADPDGMHGAIWNSQRAETYEAPADRLRRYEISPQ